MVIASVPGPRHGCAQVARRFPPRSTSTAAAATVAPIGQPQANLAEFDDTLRIAGIVPVSGRGRVQAWASLDARRVVGLHADIALEDVVLRGTAPGPGQAAPTQALGIVSMDARWSGSAGQWEAAASRLRIGRGPASSWMDRVMRNASACAPAIDAPVLGRPRSAMH